jgi:hypothetical protein
VFDGAWQKFVEVLRTVDGIPEVFPKSAPLGSRPPIKTAASLWLLYLSQKLSSRRILIFDYCSETNSEMAVTPCSE